MKAIIKFFKNQWEKSSLLGKATMFTMLSLIPFAFLVLIVLIYPDEFLK